MAKRVSCGVVVTDGQRVLLGHATRSTRWDIPKGLCEPGELPVAAALRELREETGLDAPADALAALGVHRYLPGKDLCLFGWRPPVLPDPATLRCASLVHRSDGSSFPEFDRWALFGWPEAAERVGVNLRRVLASVRDGAIG